MDRLSCMQCTCVLSINGCEHFAYSARCYKICHTSMATFFRVHHCKVILCAGAYFPIRWKCGREMSDDKMGVGAISACYSHYSLTPLKACRDFSHRVVLLPNRWLMGIRYHDNNSVNSCWSTMALSAKPNEWLRLNMSRKQAERALMDTVSVKSNL